MIFIRDEKFHFIPVYQVISGHKINNIYGIFNINKVNLSDAMYSHFDKKIVNKKLLELTKNRDNAIIKIILLSHFLNS